MYKSALKKYEIKDNGRIGITYLDTERYQTNECEVDEFNEFELRYSEYKLIDNNEFREMFLRNSSIELEDSLILDFSLGQTSELNDDAKELSSEANYIALKMTDCYLLANGISTFQNFKIRKIILNKCIIDIRRIDLVSLSMDGNSQFEFNECKFINSEINFYNFIINNGHFVISNCEFSNSLVTLECKITDSNVFITENTFVESRFYISKSYFTNSRMYIAGDFKYSIDIFFQTIYCNNSYLHLRINNVSMRDKNILQFEEINFEGGKFSFEYSNLNNSFICFDNCKFNTFTNISVANCKEINFYNSTVNSGIMKIDIKNGCEKISILDLINTGVIDIDWNSNRVSEAIGNSFHESYYDLSKQFLILKDSYNKLGYYEYEDEAYILYKRYQLMGDLISGCKSKNLFKKITSSFQFLMKKIFVDLVGEFGMNPKRIAIFMLCLIGGFGLMYSLFPNTYFSGIDKSVNGVDKIYDSLYFSGITFLTIGYGDIQPLGILKIFTIIEGFFGVLSMSYFVVSFSRKIIR